MELWIDYKTEPRPSQFPYVNVSQEFKAGERHIRIPVFAAPFISPRMAEVCQEHGWSWFDLAGNCRLDVPGVFLRERMGCEPSHAPTRASANLSTPEAARVIRALLAPENAGLGWSQWDLQRECQPHVSIGLVNKVVRHLRDTEFIKAVPDGRFRIRDPLGLLTVWRDAYRLHRHERLFTLLQRTELQKALAKLGSLTGNHVVYASFSAAEIQAPHVRQPKTWLFVDSEYEEKFCEVAKAKPVGSGENLVVFIPSDRGVFYGQEGGTLGEPRLSCTNAVQTYVDLFHCGERGEEAAEALLNQRLKPEWKRHGLLSDTNESITMQQWNQIREFIHDKLKTENPFRTTSLALQRRFGLRENFYDRMLEVSKDDVKRRFGAKSYYRRPDQPGHIFDIEFRC